MAIARSRRFCRAYFPFKICILPHSYSSLGYFSFNSSTRRAVPIALGNPKLSTSATRTDSQSSGLRLDQSATLRNLGGRYHFNAQALLRSLQAVHQILFALSITWRQAVLSKSGCIPFHLRINTCQYQR